MHSSRREKATEFEVLAGHKDENERIASPVNYFRNSVRMMVTDVEGTHRILLFKSSATSNNTDRLISLKGEQ
jgi:hypothetical protein